MIILTALLGVATFNFVACAPLDFPPNFPKCKDVTEENDAPRFSKCFIEAADKARTFLLQGIKEIGIPSIKDIIIPSITIEQKTRALSFLANLYNVSVHGLENYNVSYVNVSPKNRTYWITIKLPYITLDGIYDIEGRVFEQYLSQKGNFKATINDTSMDLFVVLKLYKKKDIDYFKVAKLELEPDIGNAVGVFDNLFGENQVLNKATNAFLEDSTTKLIEAAKPDVIKLINSLLQRFGEVISAKIPFYSVFLKN